MLSFTGEPAASVRLVAKANHLNPAAPFWYLWALGTACFSMERYAEAAGAFKKAVGHNPHFIFPRLGLAASYGRLGEIGDAQAAFAKCLSIFPDLTVDWIRDVVPYDESTTSRPLRRWLDKGRPSRLDRARRQRLKFWGQPSGRRRHDVRPPVLVAGRDSGIDADDNRKRVREEHRDKGYFGPDLVLDEEVRHGIEAAPEPGNE